MGLGSQDFNFMHGAAAAALSGVVWRGVRTRGGGCSCSTGLSGVEGV